MNQSDIQYLQNLLATKNSDELRKNLTTASGFLGVNLEQTAKLMLPLFAGVRNSLPVDTPEKGAPAAIWRMQLGYGAYDFGANMGTAFGGNGAATTPGATTITAPYKTQSIKGDVQWEAIAQAKGWDDALRIETAIALSSLIQSDELLVIGGNSSALTPPTVTGNPSTATTLNTFAAGVWSVFVTALTKQGAMTNQAGNSNVGESAVSVRCDITVPAGDADFLSISFPAVPGAIGYKIYCNAAVGGGNTAYLVPVANLRYKTGNLTTLGDAILVPTGQTFVGVNNLQIAAPPANTQPVPPAGDGTGNDLQFEGLLSWCTKSTVYGTSGLTHSANVDMNGGSLTTYGAGILEIDQVLESLWTQWKISPTRILTSPKGVVSMGNHIIAANNGNMYRIEMASERGKLVGGVFIGGYINKFAASLTNQSANVDVWAHPDLNDGTFLFLSENIPYQYSQTGRAYALDVQTPYTYWELGRTQRSIPFDVFFSETLKCYHPMSQAAIQGARVDN